MLLRHAIAAALAAIGPMLLMLAACGGGGPGAAPTGPLPAPAPAPAVRLPATFQAAQAALGQASFDLAEPNQGLTETGPAGLYLPVGLALNPQGDLLVVDAGHHRVLLFPSVPTTMAAEAEAAIGQPDLHSGGPSLTQGGMKQPFGVAVGAGRMAVADALAHRVLVYDRVPVRGQPMPVPVAVIGQQDFESGAPDCGRASLAFPSSVAITPGGKLIVADSWNHRVLVWDALPGRQEDVRPPTRVLGQGLLTRCTRNDDNEDGAEDLDPRTGLSRASARTMRFPSGVWSDGDRLVVADTANHRVLIWRHFPQQDFQPADVVLGHTDFQTTDPNNKRIPPNASTLFGPQDIDSDGTSLVVADTANHRVLIWKQFPDTDFEAAEIVLGHPDFHRRLVNDQNNDERPDAPTDHILNGPLKVLLTPQALLVSDSHHHRVLVFGR